MTIASGMRRRAASQDGTAPSGMRSSSQSDIVPIEKGGTGKTTAADARGALEVPGLHVANVFTGSVDEFKQVQVNGPVSCEGSLTVAGVSGSGNFDPTGLTDARNYDLPDASGTLALLSDITGGGLADGDKGDIVVSGSGATWSIDSTVATTAGRALMDDATAADQRTTLGLGTAAVAATGDFAPSSLTLASIIGAIYPVGAIYMSELSTNPGTLWGVGTWALHGVGRVAVCLDAGDTDWDVVGETVGSKTVAAAGSNAAEAAHTHNAGAISWPAGVPTAANESAHTHTYTDVPNHTHTVTISAGTTDGTWASFDSSTTAGTGHNYTTSNPSGGVASGTTAAGSAHTHTLSWPAGVPTSAATAAGSSHNHAFTGTATSVVQPSIAVYRWKRTA